MATLAGTACIADLSNDVAAAVRLRKDSERSTQARSLATPRACIIIITPTLGRIARRTILYGSFRATASDATLARAELMYDVVQHWNVLYSADGGLDRILPLLKSDPPTYIYQMSSLTVHPRAFYKFLNI